MNDCFKTAYSQNRAPAFGLLEPMDWRTASFLLGTRIRPLPVVALFDLPAPNRSLERAPEPEQMQLAVVVDLAAQPKPDKGIDLLHWAEINS